MEHKRGTSVIINSEDGFDGIGDDKVYLARRGKASDGMSL